MEWTEDMFATEPVLEKIEELEQQLAEANELIEKCLYFPANSGLEEELDNYVKKHNL